MGNSPPPYPLSVEEGCLSTKHFAGWKPALHQTTQAKRKRLLNPINTAINMTKDSFRCLPEISPFIAAILPFIILSALCRHSPLSAGIQGF